MAYGLSNAYGGRMTLALYIHWPFCVLKCPYCDFNSHVRDSVDVEAWQSALLADMQYEKDRTKGSLSSIFFGGGTPSLMPPDLVRTLIERAQTLWGFDADIEITLEANPSSVETAAFADLARAGVNRLSLGVQSFDDAQLRFLGRAHDAEAAHIAIETAQRHFERVSFDLIYALPGQTMTDWERQLERALAYGTEHLSLYQLTFEPGTRFATDMRRGDIVPLDDDDAAPMFEYTAERTAAAGLPAYEISNHAKAGAESRHNLIYWRYQDYVGIGPGAHGRRSAGGDLFATERHKKPENFLNAVERNGHGSSLERALSADEQAREAVMMGLRLAEGIDVDALARRFDSAPGAIVQSEAVAKLVEQRLLVRDKTRISLTEDGRLLLNAILAEILPD